MNHWQGVCKTASAKRGLVFGWSVGWLVRLRGLWKSEQQISKPLIVIKLNSNCEEKTLKLKLLLNLQLTFWQNSKTQILKI